MERARPLRILADGRDLHLTSWGATGRAALGRRGHCGRYWRPDPHRRRAGRCRQTCCPPPVVEQAARRASMLGLPGMLVRTAPLQIRVQRAAPIVVHEGACPTPSTPRPRRWVRRCGAPRCYFTWATRCIPSLGSRVTPNMHVYVRRSTPVSLGGGRPSDQDAHPGQDGGRGPGGPGGGCDGVGPGRAAAGHGTLRPNQDRYHAGHGRDRSRGRNRTVRDGLCG